MNSSQPRPVYVIPLLADMLILNSCFTLFHWGSYQKPLLMFQPSIECLVVFLIVASITLFVKQRARMFLWLAGGLCGLVLLWGIGETFTRFFYERYFVPWTDLKYVPSLVAMTMGNTPGRVVFGGAIITGVAAVTVVGSWLLFRWLSYSMKRAGPFSLSALWLVPLGFAIGFSPSLGAVIGQHLLPPVPVAFEPAKVSLERASQTPARFPFLEGRNVYLFVVESYGSTLYLNDSHAAVTHDFFANLEKRLTAGGYSIYSQFFDSPITGGRSWLADTTLVTGIRVSTEEIYAALLNQGTRANLPYLFERAGYHTTLAAPANFAVVDKDAAFMHFDTYYSHFNFGYRGPAFPWGFMPDQFFLNTIRKSVIGKDDPQFVEFVMVSSHAPFNLVPQYIDDWNAIGDGSEFYKTKNPTFNNKWLTGTQYVEGYIASEEYSLNVLADYLLKYIPPHSLVVVVGDHQPRYPVREDGETSAVPMHLLSRDKEMVSAFGKDGFTPGFFPKANAKVPGMELFFPMFVETLEGGASSFARADAAGTVKAVN